MLYLFKKWIMQLKKFLQPFTLKLLIQMWSREATV